MRAPSKSKTQLCPCCGQPVAARGTATPQVLIDFLHLGRQKRALADRLAADFGRWVPTTELHAALQPGRSTGAHRDCDPDRLLYTHMSQLRNQLRPYGLQVESGWGQRRLVWVADVAATAKGASARSGQ